MWSCHTQPSFSLEFLSSLLHFAPCSGWDQQLPSVSCWWCQQRLGPEPGAERTVNTDMLPAEVGLPTDPKRQTGQQYNSRLALHQDLDYCSNASWWAPSAVNAHRAYVSSPQLCTVAGKFVIKHIYKPLRGKTNAGDNFQASLGTLHGRWEKHSTNINSWNTQQMNTSWDTHRFPIYQSKKVTCRIFYMAGTLE
jgi:hypothetical protein